MQPKTHVLLLNSILFTLFVSLIVFAIFEAEIMNQAADVFNVICSAMLLIPMVSVAYIYMAPVRCCQMGCLGRMLPRWQTERAEFRLRLQYRCEDCDEIYITNFTVGFGEPY